MDTIEAIRSRRSIRVFNDSIPPKETIQECLEAATWAPNPTNQQPWEFMVVAGDSLKNISETVIKTFPQRMKEVDPYKGIPKSCEERKNETFEKIVSAAKEEGIDIKDLFQKNLAFYGAPVAVLFMAYKMEHSLYRHATAAALQNFLLAAHAKGLGTCWLSSVAACQEEIKTLLKISDEKEILDGVALGYPNPDSPLNSYPRTRLPVKKVTTWLGF
jgi:nitroreductase